MTIDITVLSNGRNISPLSVKELDDLYTEMTRNVHFSERIKKYEGGGRLSSNWFDADRQKVHSLLIEKRFDGPVEEAYSNAVRGFDSETIRRTQREVILSTDELRVVLAKRAYTNLVDAGHGAIDLLPERLRIP